MFSENTFAGHWENVVLVDCMENIGKGQLKMIQTAKKGLELKEITWLALATNPDTVSIAPDFALSLQPRQLVSSLIKKSKRRYQFCNHNLCASSAGLFLVIATTNPFQLGVTRYQATCKVLRL